MRFKSLLTAGFGTLLMFTAAPAAAAACCEDKSTCRDSKVMSCCTHADHEASTTAVDVLFQMDRNAIRAVADNPNARQTAVVWFHRPVWVGRHVFMGKYVIEHDTDRQARGEPCTHIYAANDRTRPVAVFHCTHLDRDRVEKDTVVLQTLSDGTRRLVEFQFGGETAGHGYPSGR